MSADGAELTAELWVRSAVPEPIRRTQRRVHDRLLTLRDRGSIDEVAVDRWGTYLYVGDGDRTPPRADPAHIAVAAFERWAEREGRDLEPAFQSFEITDDEREESADPAASRVVRLPILGLAIYEGDVLREVAPCSTDGGAYTVQDAIAEIETEARFVAAR